MSAPHWLLDVEIDGRPYRWSEVGVSVTAADGTVLVYSPGLGDPELAQGDAATVAVQDPSVNWPRIAPQLDGRICTLRRWTTGTRLEAAEVYSYGEATGVSFGAPDEAASWAIELVPGSDSLGFQVPDPNAAISYDTWPIGGGGFSVGQFSVYPVVLGYPGYIAEVATSVAVMPVSIAQWPAVAAAGTTYVVVAEDGAAGITSVVVRNDSAGVQATETVSVVTDLLRRRVLAANFTLSAVPLPTTSTAKLYVGFGPAGGGGPRSSYDAIVYLLRRWGGASATDWSRMPEARDALAPFLVDTWIDQPISDPWSWVESLVEDLPVVIRVGRAGRYLAARRYVSDPTRRVGSVTAGRDVVRMSPVARDGLPVNEFVATYRTYADGQELGRVVLTGSSSPASSPRTIAVPATSLFQSTTVARSAVCLASVARYGLRQTEPVAIDWTWDTGTVVASLVLRAERQALPAFLVSYEVRAGEDLREGDELLLTDAELGWSAVPAIVDAPPSRGVTTTALLRVLGL